MIKSVLMPSFVRYTLYAPLLALVLFAGSPVLSGQFATVSVSGTRVFPLAHPFHASVCYIEHNPLSKTLEISLKLFGDDLDLALTHAFGKRFFVGTAAETPDTQERLKEFLQKNLRFTVNGTPMPFVFLGKESPDDANFELWCHLEIGQVANLSQLEVSNTLLVDRFNDQTNIVKIKANGKTESLVLNHWKTVGNCRF
jgi:hypothetical protein